VSARWGAILLLMRGSDKANLECVECGADIRSSAVQSISPLCSSCEKKRITAAVAAFEIGTYVLVNGKSGAVVEHGVGVVAVQQHDTGQVTRVHPDALIRSRTQPKIDELLPEDDCAIFDVSPHEAELLRNWIACRIAFVISANGKYGGSGVFVSTPTGGVALLTARHVLAGALEDGGVAVVACHVDPSIEDSPRKRRSVVVNSALWSEITDAALLLMPPGFTGSDVLSFADWVPEGYVPPSQEESAASAGIILELVTGMDAERRVIAGIKVEVLSSKIVSIDPKTNELQIWVNPSLTGVTSFGGMSGGPVFATRDRRLLGINVTEHIAPTGGIIKIAPRWMWTDLVAETLRR
jgi:hypothetical protein